LEDRHILWPGAKEDVANASLAQELAKIRSTGKEPDAAEMEALAKKYADAAGEPSPQQAKKKERKASK
jgi:hypothetical protein